MRPVLEYVSSIWSPYLLKHINAFEKVHKRFTKCEYSLSCLSYPERLAAMNLEPLELKNDLVMYYECLNNILALPSGEYFCQQHQVSQTRSGCNRLIAPLCNTNRLKNDFLNRSLNCYNNIPAQVVNENFVYSLKKFLRNTDLYVYLHCNYFQLDHILFMLGRCRRISAKWHSVRPTIGSWNHILVFLYL